MPVNRLCARLVLLAAFALATAGCGGDDKPLPKGDGGKTVDPNLKPKKNAAAAD